MEGLKFKPLQELLPHYDLLLFDMWGVLIEGGETYPKIVETMNGIATEKNILFVTNAPRPNQVIVDNLHRWGFKNIDKKQVFTSGDVARNIIQEKFIDQDITPKIFHLGKEQNDQILEDIPHKLTEDLVDADILLLTIYKDEHEDYRQFDSLLAEVSNHPNLLVLCANPDTIVPNKGITRYCPGYFASIIEQHGGTVIYTGKPEKEIYESIFVLHPSVEKHRILMIGDTFETDMLGAKKAGIDSALVLTGNSQKIHGAYPTIEDKLEAIYKYGQKMMVYPSFVTSITD